MIKHVKGLIESVHPPPIKHLISIPILNWYSGWIQLLCLQPHCDLQILTLNFDEVKYDN